MTNATAIRPFHIDIPRAELDERHDRLDRARLPHPVQDTESDWSRGIAPDYLRELADYWRHGFDWRAQEAKLNVFDQCTTEIAGQSMEGIRRIAVESSAITTRGECPHNARSEPGRADGVRVIVLYAGGGIRTAAPMLRNMRVTTSISLGLSTCTPRAEPSQVGIWPVPEPERMTAMSRAGIAAV